ncbi:hypothetical protein Emag_001629 [Eimeria magna]
MAIPGVSLSRVIVSLVGSHQPQGLRGLKPQTLEGLDCEIFNVPFNPERKHYPYAEAANHVLEAHKRNVPVLVFDTCGEIFAPGVAASFLVLSGIGVIKALSHIKRKADYAKLDSTVVTELYRLAGGLRPSLEKAISLGEEGSPLLLTPSALCHPDNAELPSTLPEIPSAEEAVSEFLATAGVEQAREGLQVLIRVLDNVSQHPHAEKYRRLKLDNPRLKESVSCHKPLLRILRLSGFTGAPGASELILPPDASLSRLQACLAALQRQQQQQDEQQQVEQVHKQDQYKQQQQQHQQQQVIPSSKRSSKRRSGRRSASSSSSSSGHSNYLSSM